MNTPTYRITNAEFVTSAPDLARCPDVSLPEVAIAGRSNVGKSSLINLACNRKNLAKTSGTPGKTRLINFFKLTIAPADLTFHLVDLPGFGYAKVSKAMKNEWDKALGGYLEGREGLTGIVQLVDARHEPTKLDQQMREWILHAGIPSLTVMTKTDKLKKGERTKNPERIRHVLHLQEDEPLIATSVLKKEGVRDFLSALAALVEGRAFNDPVA